MLLTTAALCDGTQQHCSSMIRQRCASLQVGFDLSGVLPKGALDLLVEVGVPAVDVIHICIRPEGAAAAVGSLTSTLVIELCHHGINALGGHLSKQQERQSQQVAQAAALVAYTSLNIPVPRHGPIELHSFILHITQ